jgi:putative sterol carrier protein
MLQKLTDRLGSAVQDAEALEGSIAYRFFEGGSIRIEWQGTDATVTNSDEKTDAVVELSMETLTGIMDGTLDPTRAFRQGKLRLVGELSLPMKMTNLIQNTRS